MWGYFRRVVKKRAREVETCFAHYGHVCCSISLSLQTVFIVPGTIFYRHTAGVWLLIMNRIAFIIMVCSSLTSSASDVLKTINCYQSLQPQLSIRQFEGPRYVIKNYRLVFGYVLRLIYGYQTQPTTCRQGVVEDRSGDFGTIFRLHYVDCKVPRCYQVLWYPYLSSSCWL